MPFVIQGLNCHCSFNFTLIFGKHSLYQERKISRILLYASLTFCKILILFQSILLNFLLKFIDWLVWNITLKNILLRNFSVYLVFCSKDDRKMVRNICFHNSSLNFYIVHDIICKYAINCSTSVPCDTCLFVYRRKHSKSKY